MADPCPTCGGTGFTVVEDGTAGPPVTQVCLCVLRRQIVANLERGMRGLSEAMPLDKGVWSPLRDHTRNDLRVTGSPEWFTSHLRHTAARMDPDWGFRVVTDADLVVAWLATAALQGTDILDADVRSEAAPVSLSKLTLVDISAPPALLVIRLGVKVARNSATPEVLYEALTIRAHEGKPTWLWDQPDRPFDEAHLAYSRLIDEFTERWARVHENDVPRPSRPKARGGTSPAPAGNGGGARSVRDLMFGDTGGGKRR